MTNKTKRVTVKKDIYVKKKKDMNFQSVESMQSVVNVVNEATSALNDKNRTIRESAIPEVLAGALGAGIGGVASFATLYGLGVADILTGRMTTIDKTGKIVSQIMENYADRKERDIFAAIAKQIIHFKSDITTSMGLPTQLMGLFNLLQFGSIG